ncbi:recombinase zinc beta ribbon domain-containing protein [Bradyrhizobium sp. S3.2.12]|uniref:zinc ribbon domain-containing protein n=1 Tax=Bradyrhizobium sp. S3.2.12 TaxID=3156387 RepID=UPI003391C974
MREGAALLQGLAVCGHCGRRLAVHYSGRFSAPGYHCAGKNIVNGRGEYYLNIGGVQIDAAVAEAFLAALAPAGLEASLQAIEQFDADHETALAQFRRDVERARYNAQRAERRYRAVDPENRLVARGLEAEWESALLELKTAESKLSDREHARPRSLTHEERDAILALGKDLKRIWFAPTTSDRDRKELLRTLLDDVTLRVERDKYNAHLTLRWRGGLFSEVNVPLPHSHPSPIRTADDATLHRCLNDGFIAGEQITPGAPWRIRINDELRSRFVESATEGYVKMFKAMNLLGVSRQTILQRVKRGEPKAVHVYRGRAKGIRILVPAAAPDLFDPLKKTEGVV